MTDSTNPICPVLASSTGVTSQVAASQPARTSWFALATTTSMRSPPGTSGNHLSHVHLAAPAIRHHASTSCADPFDRRSTTRSESSTTHDHLHHCGNRLRVFHGLPGTSTDAPKSARSQPCPWRACWLTAPGRHDARRQPRGRDALDGVGRSSADPAPDRVRTTHRPRIGPLPC